MQALHHTVLPPSAIHHALYLPHFTPSTIYPFPQPTRFAARRAEARAALNARASGGEADGQCAESKVDEDEDRWVVKVKGNLVVAGGSDLRVFEVREQPSEFGDNDVQAPNKLHPQLGGAIEPELAMDEDGVDQPKSTQITIPHRTLQLHLVYSTSLHGIVTGLTSIRTMASLEDGLDRLLVGFREAKMSLLEWSAGEIITVSMHTYERCVQVVNGDGQGHTPLLRSDPGSRLAILTLPSNSFAMLPFVQDPTDLEGLLGLGPDGTAATSSAATDALIRAIPYMSSYVLPLERLSPGIKNVKDVVFLEGFNTPTLAILYEPMRTWIGRQATLRDTYALDIWTLDVVSQAYANLTSVKGLPSDCQSIVACPSGIGGILVVAGSSLLHVDQNGNVVGTSVNGWFGMTTALAQDSKVDRREEARMLELDGAKLVWVGDRDLLLIVSDGRSLQVTVELEGRSVSALRLGDMIARDLCRPKTVVKVGSDGTFVGSAVGDSLLLRMHFEALEKATLSDDLDLGGDGQNVGPDGDIDMDVDLYGDSEIRAEAAGNDSANLQRRLRLRVCDRLQGVGYISDLLFGESVPVGRPESELKPEMVALCGGGGKSSVNVFRQGLRERKRRVLKEIDADGPIWHMAVRPKGLKDESKRTVIFANQAEETRIYSLNEELEAGEQTTLPDRTIHASSWSKGSTILRVTTTSIHLMDQEGGVLLEVPLDLEAGISVAAVNVSDPYILLKASTGEQLLFKDQSEGSDHRLTRVGSTIKDIRTGQAMLFTDTSGIFRTFEAGARSDHNNRVIRTDTASMAKNSTDRMQLTDDQLQRLQAAKPEYTAESSESIAATSPRRSVWFLTTTKEGLLHIRSMSDMAIVFSTDGLKDASRNMIDDPRLDTVNAEASDFQMDGLEDEDAVQVENVCLTALGLTEPRPYLLVILSTGQLLCYEAQPRFTLDALTADASRRSLAIRFRKTWAVDLQASRLPRTLLPVVLSDDASAAFISGSNPAWVMASATEVPRLVAHGEAVEWLSAGTSPGPSLALITKDEAQVTATMIDADRQFTHLEMTCDRIQLERSYTHITFDPASRHYLGVSALPTPFQVYSDECELIPGPSEPNLTQPLCERSCLELFEPGSWTSIDGYEFAENEVVDTIKSVRLEATSVSAGHKDFIAVGTTVNRGEDLSGKGNTYIFEVEETVSAEAVEVMGMLTPPRNDRRSSPAAGYKPHVLRLLVREEGFAPVTCLAEVSGYLVQVMGQKIFVKALDLEERLVAVAFLDLGVYIAEIAVFKNLLLLGDLVKSVWFAAFQEEPFKLEVIAKEIINCSIATCDFIASENKLGMVTTDREGSLRLLEFDPTHPASNNGERLVRKTEFGMSGRATTSLATGRRKNLASAPDIHLFFATEYGAINSLVPSKQARYKRLQLLQGQLVRGAQHFGGLNPRGHRYVPNDFASRPLSKGILDGQLLDSFLTLPISKQRELTGPLGTNRETVLNDLTDLKGGSAEGGWFW